MRTQTVAAVLILAAVLVGLVACAHFAGHYHDTTRDVDIEVHGYTNETSNE